MGLASGLGNVAVSSSVSLADGEPLLQRERVVDVLAIGIQGRKGQGKGVLIGLWAPEEETVGDEVLLLLLMVAMRTRPAFRPSVNRGRLLAVLQLEPCKTVRLRWSFYLPAHEGIGPAGM